MPRLVGIANKPEKRAPMQLFDRAFISLAKGVENDFRGKPSKRQVTVMSETAWQEVNAELGMNLPWTLRRANLLVDDIDLENSAAQMLMIGEVKLLITQETDPCQRMRETADGLFDALNVRWRGGVCCRVICEGQIRSGDDVILIDESAT